MTGLAKRASSSSASGGSAAPAAWRWRARGSGRSVIADDDVVEESNLHRQILFDEADVGAPKAAAAAARPRGGSRRAVRVSSSATRAFSRTTRGARRGHDVVVEGSDNFATKFLVADACAHRAASPVVHGAAVRWHGTALAVGAAGAPATAASSRTSRGARAELRRGRRHRARRGHRRGASRPTSRSRSSTASPSRGRS